MPDLRTLVLGLLAVAAVGVVLGLLFGFSSQPTIIGVVVGVVAALRPARLRRPARQGT